MMQVLGLSGGPDVTQKFGVKAGEKSGGVGIAS
jgi:hypothetical protein